MPFPKKDYFFHYGSQVIAYADRAYGLAAFLGRPVTLPVGRMKTSSQEEEKRFAQAEETYGVNTKEQFYTINDRKISDWNFIDLAIQVSAGVLVAVAAFALLRIRKNRKKNG